MELTWSIEEVATLSDDVVVRRRFDQRNFIWLVLLLVFFGVVAVIAITSDLARRTPLDLAIGVTNLIVIALLLFLIRDAHRITRGGDGIWGPARWIRNHMSATVIGYVTVQFALSLAFARRGDNWMAWAMIFPFLMLGFRTVVAELVLLHAVLVAGGIVMSFISPIRLGEARHQRAEPQGASVRVENPVPPATPISIVNVLALGVGLAAAHRLRRQVIGEFNERRKQAREQIRMRDELRYARELQVSMLPECAPSLPWVDICSTSLPATEVGGDYYDYFIDGERIALVCGDVAGHGMASGLVLSALRSGFTLLRDSLDNPAAVLARLHDLVAQTTRRRMLVTVAVVLLDRATNTATIASAGHPPVLLRRADGTVETINLFAPPLGVRLPVDIPQRRIDVAPGDTFVLHSDGVYETRNAAGEAYGLERLERLVRDRGDTSAETLRDTILSDVATFRGDVEPDDDVTVVVCRLT